MILGDPRFTLGKLSLSSACEANIRQSLSLRKIGNQFDPVVLTYSHSLTEEQDYDSMVFSIGEYQSVHKNDRDLA